MEDEKIITSPSENTTEPVEDEPAPDPIPEDPAEQEPGQEEDSGQEEPGGEVPSESPGDHQEQQPVDEETIAEKVVEMLQPEKDSSVEEKIDMLLEMISPKTYENAADVPVSPSIPIEGYRDWYYGITVNLDIYPYGLGHWTKVTETFSTPEEFETRYAQWCSYVGDTVDSFYMATIYDAGGNEVYNYETYQEPEPEEPEPEGPVHEDQTVARLLSHLDGLNGTLTEMTATDIEFYESVLLYQENMLELQKTDVALDIIIAVGIFLIFGALLVEILMEKVR